MQFDLFHDLENGSLRFDSKGEQSRECLNWLCLVYLAPNPSGTRSGWVGFYVTTLEQGAGFTLSFQKVSRLMASYNPIDAA